jgi:acetate kinase
MLTSAGPHNQGPGIGASHGFTSIHHVSGDECPSDYFVDRIGRELGALAAVLKGLDTLVFTAGIGEHAGEVRARVCHDAAWLGVALDEEANRRGEPRISKGGRVPSVWVIPTNEELMIARHILRLICASTASKVGG